MLSTISSFESQVLRTTDCNLSVYALRQYWRRRQSPNAMAKKYKIETINRHRSVEIIRSSSNHLMLNGSRGSPSYLTTQISGDYQITYLHSVLCLCNSIMEECPRKKMNFSIGELSPKQQVIAYKC